MGIMAVVVFVIIGAYWTIPNVVDEAYGARFAKVDAFTTFYKTHNNLKS